jgi:peroxiredoxin
MKTVTDSPLRRPISPAQLALRASLVALVPLVVIGGIALAAWLRERGGETTVHPRSPAPMFALPDQTGRIHKLSDYAERPVALAFVPGDDLASEQELRSINEQIRRFDTLGVKVFGIAQVSAESARRMHDGSGLEFPILCDKNGEVAREYGTRSATNPDGRVSFVIGRDQRIILPILPVAGTEHGQRVVELTECCLDSNTQTASPLLNKPVADFHLPRVSDGKPEPLYAKGSKATVLFFLSSLCPCSAKYDERVDELARQYTPRGVRFLAVNSSEGEKPAEVAAYAKRAGYPFPVLKDEGNVIADRVHAQITPEVFVMDAKGVLRYHGGIDDSRSPKMVQQHHLRNALDFLLGGRLPARAEAITFGCAIARRSPTQTASAR